MPLDAVMIGVAVVEASGRYLVGHRQSDQSLPGRAEFPGGKCEGDESPMLCAVRECREEAGLEVEPVMLLGERCFEYEHETVELRFWLCKPIEKNIDLEIEHNGFRWMTVSQLVQEEFPAANEPLLEKLRLEGPFFDRCS